MDKLKKILKSELGLLLVLALLCVVFAVASPHFLKQQNLLNITPDNTSISSPSHAIG